MENTVYNSQKKQPKYKVVLVTLFVVLLCGGLGFLVGKGIYFLIN